MAITKEQVQHVAKLARLGLTEAEEAAMAEQLSRILEHMAQLDRLPTSQVSPTFSVQPLQNVFRPDRVQPSLGQEIALANGPASQGGCFVVPKIAEG